MAVRSIGAEERRARLGTRHHLAGSAAAPDPVSLAWGLIAYHATDPASVYLAARARIADLDPAQVSVALYDDRTLVRMLGMRRTMFVVPTAFVPVVQHSSSDAVAARIRARLIKELAEVMSDPEPWLADVCDSVVAILRENGPALAQTLAKAEPRLQTQLLIAEGKAYGGPQAITSRVLNQLSAESRIVRGRPTNGWAGSRYRWEVVETWLPAGVPQMATLDARVELVQRWLARFGPATLADLVWWTGWNQRDTKQALAALEVVEVDLDGQPGLLLAEDLDPVPAPEPWIAFLPTLDPTPMGWYGRDWYLPASHRRELFDTNGNIGPTVWCDGRIVGGWGQTSGGEVAYRLLEAVGRKPEKAIVAEAVALTKWLDGVRITPRFRTPLEKALAQS